MDEVTEAIAFVQKNPGTAAAPPTAPPVATDFAPPESEKGRFPGREVTLNQLKENFDRLNEIPGGDLGGLRPKIHGEIATAAKETINDIIHERQSRDFNSVRNALQRAGNNIGRTDDNAHTQRAAAAVRQAIQDVAAALTFIEEHPGKSAPVAAAVLTPDFSPAAPDRGRYPGREASLNPLKSAYDVLIQIPGGDFGGLRSKIQNEIITAADEALADIAEAALRERNKSVNAARP